MMPYQNPYLTNPYMQQAIVPPVMQQMTQQTPALQQQQTGASIRVSGRDEAMNRFLMMYPANMLVPGFISDALFDIDGRHFHALSIESDGSRNLTEEMLAWFLEHHAIEVVDAVSASLGRPVCVDDRCLGGHHGDIGPVAQ